MKIEKYEQMVFGENYPKYVGVLSRKDLGPEEAKLALKAIVHPEIREMLDSVQDKAEKDWGRFSYVAGTRENIIEDIEYRLRSRIGEKILFTKRAENDGLVSAICGLLHMAYPDYDVFTENLEFVMEKKFIQY